MQNDLTPALIVVTVRSIKVLRICMCPTRLVPDTDPAVGHHGLGMPPHCTRVMHGSQTASSWPLEARFAHAPELLVLPDGTVVLPLQLVDLREAR